MRYRWYSCFPEHMSSGPLGLKAPPDDMQGGVTVLDTDVPITNRSELAIGDRRQAGYLWR